MSVTNNRIDYIDLAKGFCILFVVFNHVCKIYGYSDSLLAIQGSFRMPLYFILSGLFFKQYGGFRDFIRRKTNKLIVPFFFFYLFLSFLLPIAMDVVDGISGGGNFSHITYRHIAGLALGWMKGRYFNDATWFLVALFMTNVLFYTLSKVRTLVLQIFLSAMLGVIGCYLSLGHISLPFRIDTAFTVIPFFAFGYFMRKYTTVLFPNKHDKYNWLFVILLSLFFVIPYKLGLLSALKINAIYCNPLIFYICGISGTMVVMLVSKMLRSLPYISYVGRYSIMVLVTHWAFLKCFHKYVGNVCSNPQMNVVLIFLITMFFCTILIPLMKKCIPQFTAQEDLIKCNAK